MSTQKKTIPMVEATPESRAEFIHNNESSIYGGVDQDGNKVDVFLEQGVGMDVHVYQDNGWILVLEYGKNGYLESESFNGKWK